VPGDRILVHVGCAALPDAVELAKDAVGRGSPCMMLPPFFLKGVPDAGVIESFAWLIDGVADPRLKLYLYHIPAVSGVGISAATIRALKKRYPQTVMGIKDSSCDLPHALEMARQFAGEMAVFVGFEPHLPAVRRAGGSGTVCGIANMMPRLINRLVDKYDAPSVEADLAKVQRLLDAIAPYSLMPAFKGMMAELTGEPGWLRVRPPLAQLSETEHRQLVRDMAGIGIDRAAD
jgi:4-hydroxy-tetrahydrodipicolinate synthase